jgi:tripartite-type tricarboxylate transporter receptor subunit TctC
MTFRGAAVCLILLSCAAGQALAADAEADFYKGKQIKLIIGSPPGGLYDGYGRLISRFLPNHIPGNPVVIVENMGTASGMPATTYIYEQAPKDGTVIGGTLSSIPTAPLTSPNVAKFDVNKLSWIGSITKDPFVGYVWHTAPIKTLEEAKTVSVSMGGQALGGAGVDMSILANKFFGFKFKIVTGYSGSGATKLAMERGEVDGTFANSYGDLRTQQIDWLREKKVTIIVQHGFEKHPDLPDVPLFMDQAKTPEDRQMLEFMLARQEFSKPYFAPPGIPAARLKTLRDGFTATMKDPEFRAAAEKAHLAVESPMTGQELADMVGKVSSTPTAVVKKIQATFDEYSANH